MALVKPAAARPGAHPQTPYSDQLRHWNLVEVSLPHWRHRTPKTQGTPSHKTTGSTAATNWERPVEQPRGTGPSGAPAPLPFSTWESLTQRPSGGCVPSRRHGARDKEWQQATYRLPPPTHSGRRSLLRPVRLDQMPVLGAQNRLYSPEVADAGSRGSSKVDMWPEKALMWQRRPEARGFLRGYPGTHGTCRASW